MKTAVADAGVRFLGRLAPQDRVALLTLPTGPKIDFTTDRARLTEGLRSLSGTSLNLGGRERAEGMADNHGCKRAHTQSGFLGRYLTQKAIGDNTGSRNATCF